MNNQKNNPDAFDRGPDFRRRGNKLPFFIEFVKFTSGFAVIVVIALIALKAAASAMQ